MWYWIRRDKQKNSVFQMCCCLAQPDMYESVVTHYFWLSRHTRQSILHIFTSIWTLATTHLFSVWVDICVNTRFHSLSSHLISHNNATVPVDQNRWRHEGQELSQNALKAGEGHSSLLETLASSWPEFNDDRRHYKCHSFSRENRNKSIWNTKTSFKYTWDIRERCLHY